MWRVRVTFSDDPKSRARFAGALHDQPVRLASIMPRDESAAVTGETVIELTRDEDLTGLLTTQHGISPQVFVSRADPGELPASAQAELAAVPNQLPAEPGHAGWPAPDGERLPGVTLGP